MNLQKSDVTTSENQEIGDITKLLNNFSLETTPSGAKKIESFSNFVRPSTTIFITFLPGTDYNETVLTAKKLRLEGLNPAPHFAARSIISKKMLEDYVERVTGEAEVRKILTVAGAGKEQLGPFPDSTSLLETGIFDKYGITEIGVAGHPEGSPDISDKEIEKALVKKNQYNELTDANLFIVSQFCFESETILEWARKINSEGNKLPIIIGIPGIAKLSTLLKYSISCGIGNSINFLKKQGSKVVNLIKTQSPDRLIRDLAKSKAYSNALGIEGLHIYPLGGLQKSSNWAFKTLDGNFKITKEGFKVYQH
ncbi:MAG: methylenetetrahydrofolate reductase [Paracoccaceae bacterium]